LSLSVKFVVELSITLVLNRVSGGDLISSNNPPADLFRDTGKKLGKGEAEHFCYLYLYHDVSCDIT